MFTGLIEETSKISEFSETSNGAIIKFSVSFSSEVKLGDSISVNGVCLTVIKIDGNFLSFEISKETLKVADFNYKKGSVVNIERAMKFDSRLDGHIVSGHIDGTAKIKNITKDGFSYNFEFETNNNISKYIVKKGSVAVNGISLTVNKIDGNTFNVEIIPHTLEKTNLKTLKTGDTVNIETDIISKYVEKFLFLKNNNTDSNITMELLKDNGYF